MSEPGEPAQNRATAVSEYKELLRQVLDARPSGTRQRLATALGKNRSFVSQIANPQYATPIPARHLDVILDICHFPQATRDAFMDAYARAHPVRLAHASGQTRLRRHTIVLPDTGDAEKNEKVNELIADFVRRLNVILND